MRGVDVFVFYAIWRRRTRRHGVAPDGASVVGVDARVSGFEA